jgi:hypothetical protein
MHNKKNRCHSWVRSVVRLGFFSLLMLRWTCSCQCMVIVLLFPAINCLCTSILFSLSFFISYIFLQNYTHYYRSSPSFYSVYLCLLFVLRHKADKVIVSSNPNITYLALYSNITIQRQSIVFFFIIIINKRHTVKQLLNFIIHDFDEVWIWYIYMI